MAIQLDGHLVATTMRTPGHDYELAAGFCLTEGLLAGEKVETVRYCATGSAMESAFNVVTVETGGRAPVPTARLTPITSSCGLCGSTELDTLMERLPPLPAAPPELTLARLAELAETALAGQPLFDATGAVHAAVAFTTDGEVVVSREDVGRHNAVDKVVGRLLLDGRLPAHDLALAVTSRASFEIVQKAWSAGFPAVVAVERADRARRRRRPAGRHDPGRLRPRRSPQPLRARAPATPDPSPPVDGRRSATGTRQSLARSWRSSRAASGQAGWRWRVGWVAGTGIAASSAATQAGRPAITRLTPGALPSTRSIPGARSTTRSDRSMWATSPTGARPGPR